MQKSSPVGMMLDFAYGRGTADSRPSADKPDQAEATGSANMALAAASRAWWESRRPSGWTLEQHLAEPIAGCDSTAQERALAQAVAHWIGQDR
jgi:hypothetical protein